MVNQQRNNQQVTVISQPRYKINSKTGTYSKALKSNPQGEPPSAQQQQYQNKGLHATGQAFLILFKKCNRTPFDSSLSFSYNCIKIC